MPAAPDYSWVANPDIITAAIKLLAGAVVSTGGALIIVLGWVWNKTDSKIDRIATSLESLDKFTATEIATIKATCKGHHPD